jgi:hypothetical protein
MITILGTSTPVKAPDGHRMDADTSGPATPWRSDLTPPPLHQPPNMVRAWFDAAAAAIPDHDGTLGTARRAARAYAHRAKAANTRLAYRAGVRAWCSWCASHTLPCLPARAAEPRRRPLSALHRRLPGAHRPGAGCRDHGRHPSRRRRHG